MASRWRFRLSCSSFSTVSVSPVSKRSRKINATWPSTGYRNSTDRSDLSTRSNAAACSQVCKTIETPSRELALGDPLAEGRLLLGATPLGQPSDASPRLVAALSTADIVAAEDTRRVRTLAKALDIVISGKVVSFFDHVEAARVPALVEQISAGATVLVVSDAGMPLINDPGHRLVAACVEAGLPVQCLPGPSAVTTALAVSGLSSEEFCFEGFAPREQGARKSWVAWLAQTSGTR